MNWSTWKSHEYDSFKATLVVLFMAVCIVIIAMQPSFRNNFLLGLVNEADATPINLTLTSIAGAEPVEEGIYGAGMAKFLDEIMAVPTWQEDTTEAIEDLSLSVLRYPTGGLVKYSHVWTDYMSQPLTAEETSALVNGNEIRGNGWIIQDRIDEEAAGNLGELAEIMDPKPVYGGLSYLEGFQNNFSRNFIHDFADLANETGADALFVVNMTYATPQEVAQQVAYLIDQGVTIRGVEMGNEVYSKGNQYFIPGNPSIQAPIAVTNYLNDADTYRTAISAVAPGLSYAVVSAPKKGIEETEDGFDSDTDFNGYWNTALATQMGAHGYSNYVMHFYAPFTPCIDEVQTGIKESIFECGKTELRTLRKSTAATELETVFPAILDWYAQKFPGKNMWLTEWNINQDPSKTASMYANSVLHGIFTQDILTMMNDANIRHGNFITYSIYHTLGTDGGNALINQRKVKGFMNSEPEDIGAFVRRTTYFALKSMKDVYGSEAVPMQATVTYNNPGINADDVTLRAYKKDDGAILITVTNTTEQTLRIGSLTIDGQVVSLENSEASIEFLEGQSNAASRGETEFEISPSDEANILEEDFNQTTELLIPGFGVGTLSIDPQFATEEEEDPADPDDCGLLEGLFGGCDEEETPTTDTKAPTVVLTSPANTMPLTTNMLLSARAKDNVGVTQVEFYAEPSGLIFTDTTEPYSYQWNTTGLAPGIYYVRAKAYDAEGNTSFSAKVRVNK